MSFVSDGIGWFSTALRDAAGETVTIARGAATTAGVVAVRISHGDENQKAGPGGTVVTSIVDQVWLVAKSLYLIGGSAVEPLPVTAGLMRLARSGRSCLRKPGRRGEFCRRVGWGKTKRWFDNNSSERKLCFERFWFTAAVFRRDGGKRRILEDFRFSVNTPGTTSSGGRIVPFRTPTPDLLRSRRRTF